MQFLVSYNEAEVYLDCSVGDAARLGIGMGWFVIYTRWLDPNCLRTYRPWIFVLKSFEESQVGITFVICYQMSSEKKEGRPSSLSDEFKLTWPISAKRSSLF